MLDITLAAHTWFESEGDEVVGTGSLAYSMVTSLGDDDTLRRKAVPPGTAVRLRLINTSGYNMTFTLTGTPFRVVAIDGADISEPTNLKDVRLEVAAGGRYDVGFAMPDGPVRLAIPEDVNVSEPNPDVGLLLSTDGTGDVSPIVNGPRFKPWEYGSSKSAPFGTKSHFDREFVQVFDTVPGFYEGKFRSLWATNGEVFPNTPTLMVREGDLVKVTFANRSLMEHPMHLHGHHVLVLSRNGQPISGSPWWADTLNVEPGESYEVAFRADNPGIWMDHCHVLDHAAEGMMMHLVYEGVVTPFEAGDVSGVRDRRSRRHDRSPALAHLVRPFRRHEPVCLSLAMRHGSRGRGYSVRFATTCALQLRE
jgi:FtsP/CotA-like multicopper oxidase with cupredoxin domain